MVTCSRCWSLQLCVPWGGREGGGDDRVRWLNCIEVEEEES